MDSNGIFALAGRRLAWLAESRAVIAGNVANANTPGYRARTLTPFEAHVAAAGQASGLAVTNVRHLLPAESSPVGEAVAQVSEGSVHSGNNVNLDAELMNAGELSRSHALTTGIVR